MPTNVKGNMTVTKTGKILNHTSVHVLRKKYHLAPAIADEDYGPDVTALDITSQQQLHDISKVLLESLCVTDTKAADLDVSSNSLWQRLR